MQFRDICAQSRKLLLNVLNFARFLLPQIIRGGDFQKLHPRYHPHLAARHGSKSHEATPFGSKDPSYNTLHFKAIFDSPLKNVVRRAPSAMAGALLKIGRFLALVKIWGRSTF